MVTLLLGSLVSASTPVACAASAPAQLSAAALADDDVLLARAGPVCDVRPHQQDAEARLDNQQIDGRRPHRGAALLHGRRLARSWPASQDMAFRRAEPQPDGRVGLASLGCDALVAWRTRAAHVNLQCLVRTPLAMSSVCRVLYCCCSGRRCMGLMGIGHGIVGRLARMLVSGGVGNVICA